MASTDFSPLNFTEEAINPDSYFFCGQRRLICGPEVDRKKLEELSHLSSFYDSEYLLCANTPYLTAASIALEGHGIRNSLTPAKLHLPTAEPLPKWSQTPAISVEMDRELFWNNILIDPLNESIKPIGEIAEWTILRNGLIGIERVGIAKLRGSGLLAVVNEAGNQLCLDRLLNGRIVRTGTLNNYLKPELKRVEKKIIRTVNTELPIGTLDVFSLMKIIGNFLHLPLDPNRVAFTINETVDNWR